MAHHARRGPVPSRPTRSDAAVNIARILEAAHRVLVSTNGACTLRTVADEAGVGLATLYRHFPGRAQLAEALYQQIFRASVEPVLVELVRGDGEHGQLLAVAERIVEVHHRERAVLASIDDPSTTISSLLAGHRSAFDTFIARGISSGTFRSGMNGSDVAPLLAIVAAGGAALGEDVVARRRYLGMLLDDLRPAHAASP